MQSCLHIGLPDEHLALFGDLPHPLVAEQVASQQPEAEHVVVVGVQAGVHVPQLPLPSQYFVQESVSG